MKIKEVTHERVRNIGNFESVRVSITAEVGTLSAEKTLEILKEKAKAFLYPEEDDDKRPITRSKPWPQAIDDIDCPY